MPLLFLSPSEGEFGHTFRRGIWSLPFLRGCACKTVGGGKTLENKGFRGGTPFRAKKWSAEGRKFWRKKTANAGRKWGGNSDHAICPLCFFFASFWGQNWKTPRSHVGGESGPKNSAVVARPCWPGFPLKKCSVLQREAFCGQDSPLWWPGFPSYSVYIYIYAVKLKTGPRFGVL